MTEAIALYGEKQKRRGTLEKSRKTTKHRLEQLLTDPDEPVEAITVARARTLYREYTEGHRVSTHRGALREAKSCFSHLVRERIIRKNPFAEVEGEGSLRHDRTQKLQLTRDEGRKFLAEAEKRLASPETSKLLSHRRILAAMIALYTGPRASEICRIVVRDFDDGGATLRIWRGKSERAKRQDPLPRVLQAHVRRFSEGLDAFDPMFPTLQDADRGRHKLLDTVKALCAAAGVPEVTTHGLRGTFASMGKSVGLDVERIAEHLGHGSTAVTEAHYIQPGTVDPSRARAIDEWQSELATIENPIVAKDGKDPIAEATGPEKRSGYLH